jgi:hypothetical protein
MDTLRTAVAAPIGKPPAVQCFAGSHEPLEPVTGDPADRTCIRRFVPCAEVAADPAPPDRVFQVSGCADCPWALLLFLAALCRRWPAIRDGSGGAHPRFHVGGDIQAAVAGAVFGEILVTVVAGADDIEVIFPVS